MLNETFSHLLHKIDRKIPEHSLFQKQDWNSIQPVFIVSTGRTGTQFFAEFFNLFPSVRSLHEPQPDFLKLGIEYAQGLVDFETASRQIELKRRAYCHELKQEGIKLYVESNNRFFSLLKPLRAVFPHSKVIYIVRDGRDYVRSGISRVWYTEHDKVPRLRADMFPDDLHAKQWRQMDRFEKIAWRWQKKDGFIHADFQHLDNALKVKFEDIFYDPERSGVYQISRFIGIPDNETRHYLTKMGNRKVNTNSKQVIPKWMHWNDEMKQAFDKIAAHHMQLHYDYQGMMQYR